MSFKRVPKIEYEPLRQSDPSQSGTDRPAFSEEAAKPSESTLSRAEQRIESFDKTIEFYDWLTSLVDDQIKDVTVRINPDEEPEVWMAMQRIFKGTAQENLNARSYIQVLDAIRDCNQLELEENQGSLQSEEDELINIINEQDGTRELTGTSEMDIIDEDETAIQAALEGRTIELKSNANQVRPRPRPKRKPLQYWYRKLWWRSAVIRWRNGKRFDFRKRKDVKRWLDLVKSKGTKKRK
jgi:hypothetical protein